MDGFLRGTYIHIKAPKAKPECNREERSSKPIGGPFYPKNGPVLFRKCQDCSSQRQTEELSWTEGETTKWDEGSELRQGLLAGQLVKFRKGQC